MPRALSMRHTIVPPGDRAGFEARARSLRDHYAGRACHYWLFEESGLPGAFVEFFEAGDAAALLSAHGTAPGAADASPRVYVEIPIP